MTIGNHECGKKVAVQYGMGLVATCQRQRSCKEPLIWVRPGGASGNNATPKLYHSALACSFSPRSQVIIVGVHHFPGLLVRLPSRVGGHVRH